MPSSNQQNDIFDPTSSPLKSLTDMVVEKLNFNICFSYVERQLEFELQQGDNVITATYEAIELQQQKLFDEASVVESVTSRTSSSGPTQIEKFTV